MTKIISRVNLRIEFILVFFLLNIYLFFDEGIEFYKNYLRIGIAGIIGAVGLGTAMITFIWSITNTSAAITLLCLSAMPFITALLGFLFLKETIFPIEFSEFMRVGEKTGTVDDMFASIATFYEAEVDESVNKLKQFIEPFMIVFIGSLIGILLLALYQPIFSLGTVVK